MGELGSNMITPPTRGQMAVMIWLAVFPTLLALQVVLGPLVKDLPMVVRTFILVSLAVPTVVYVLMPQLQKARIRLQHSGGRSAR